MLRKITYVFNYLCKLFENLQNLRKYRQTPFIPYYLYHFLLNSEIFHIISRHWFRIETEKSKMAGVQYS